MQVLAYCFVFALTITLQLTVVPLFAIKQITPDLILILVTAVAFRKGSIWGVASGFASGLVFDFFGTGFIGLSSLANSSAAFVAGSLGGEQLERRFSVVLGLLLIVVTVHDLLYFGILSIGTDQGFWSTLLRIILPHTLYTLVFVFLIHLLAPRVFSTRI